MHSHGHKTTVFVTMNSYIILEWGRLFEKGGTYWKEGAKLNSYGNHGFGGHLAG